MSSELISAKIKALLRSKACFVVFQQPDSREIRIMMQYNYSFETLMDISAIEQSGFIFHPYSTKKSDLFYIKGDINQALSEFNLSNEVENLTEISEPTVSEHNTCINFQAYENMISSALGHLKAGVLSKVVLSRCYELELNTHQLEVVFMSLTEKYPDAFTYLISIPGKQTWIGATPEILLRKSAENVKTMALAGTKRPEETRDWTEKEITEQSLVQNSIEEAFSSRRIAYQKSDLKTKKLESGLSHLLTEYEAKCPTIKDFWGLIGELHPTPAVCGLPRNKASGLISELEKYDREYYTGFLGPVFNDDSIDLYVNLRCAKVLRKGFKLYVGGGITEDSDVIQEWNETEAKAETMKSVILKVLND